jgi:hypothetical protein
MQSLRREHMMLKCAIHQIKLWNIEVVGDAVPHPLQSNLPKARENRVDPAASAKFPAWEMLNFKPFIIKLKDECRRGWES